MDGSREQKATTARSNGRDRSVDGHDRSRSLASGPERHSRYGGLDSHHHSGRDRRNVSPRPGGHEQHGMKRRQPDDFRHDRYQPDSRRPRTQYEDTRPPNGRDERRFRPDGPRQYPSYGRDAHRDHGEPGSRVARNDASSGRNGNAHRTDKGRRGSMVQGSDDSAFAPLIATNSSTVPSEQPSASAASTDPKPGEEQSEEPAPVLDEAALIEQRRKRREALRAKHKTEAPLLQKALHASIGTDAATTPDVSQETSYANSPKSEASTPPMSGPASPLEVVVLDDAELANSHNQVDNTADSPSAADYDPSMDMQEDRARNVERIAETVPQVSKAEAAKSAPAEDEDKEFDMFADDVDEDDEPGPARLINQDDGINGASGLAGKQLDKSMLDDWDDPEGYYRIILGEIIDKRYQIQTNLGKGVFSAVVRAVDNKTGSLVAIKIIRKQESMYKAGLKEIHTLEKLHEEDPEDKKHVIRLERHFMHKGHLCMVFEHLSINLREVLKKFGRDIGINIKAVRAYAQQMFLALSLLKKCDIIHADLKPDNVLVNENRSQLKMADLGSAFDIKDSEVTDILVSRFYRAPEIMLGIKGDFALDMWSIGCTLFELYTGRICFTGLTNNQMLKGILECRGKIPNRVLKRAEYWAQHFDADGTFVSQDYDTVTRKDVVRRINIARPVPAKELRARLFANSKDLSVADAKELSLFADLLDRCLSLDPLRRITPNEALRHGFINRSAATTVPAKGK